MPPQKHHSSLTRVSQSTAVLYGYDECWLLDLNNADRLKGQPSSMWSRIPTPFWRDNHAAVFEPESRRLWIIGGLDSRGRYTSDVLEMTNALLPLRDLALYHAARNFRVGDPRLFQGRFPRKLTNEIVAWRTNINAAHRDIDSDIDIDIDSFTFTFSDSDNDSDWIDGQWEAVDFA